MAYSVKEIFYSLQGEGVQAGRPSVFLRFSGCNLWSGREADRAAAACRFCDTDFVGVDGVGGGKFETPDALAAAAAALWPRDGGGAMIGAPWLVITGGEPTLQLDPPLIAACRAQGFGLAIETNGTRVVPPGLDWICVSPKGTAPLVQTSGDELKLVFPQADAPPERFDGLDFAHRLLQPLDGPDRTAHLAAAAAYCLKRPAWRLSLQTHKIIGLP